MRSCATPVPDIAPDAATIGPESTAEPRPETVGGIEPEPADAGPLEARVSEPVAEAPDDVPANEEQEAPVNEPAAEAPDDVPANEEQEAPANEPVQQSLF